MNNEKKEMTRRNEPIKQFAEIDFTLADRPHKVDILVGGKRLIVKTYSIEMDDNENVLVLKIPFHQVNFSVK